MLRVGFEAFDVIVSVPLAGPVAVGSKLTLSEALWPAVSVSGVEIPLIVNSVLFTDTCEIVTLVPPVLVSISVMDGSPPTVTLPKLIVLGLSPKTPGVTPVPVTAIVNVGLEPSEVMVTVPLAAPVD